MLSLFEAVSLLLCNQAALSLSRVANAHADVFEMQLQLELQE